MLETMRKKYQEYRNRRVQPASVDAGTNIPAEPHHRPRKVTPVMEMSVLGCCGMAGIAMLSDLQKWQLDLLERKGIGEGKGLIIAVIVEEAEQGNFGWHGSQAHVVPVLEGNGWKRLQKFYNPNSGNVLGLWSKELPKQARRGDIGFHEPPKRD